VLPPIHRRQLSRKSIPRQPDEKARVKIHLLMVLAIVLAPWAQAQETGSQGPIATSTAPAILVHPVKPKYPKEARKNDVEGLVTLEIVVASDGDLKSLKVLSGDSTLALAAVDAVLKWRFQPATFNGRSVEGTTTIAVNFTLEGEKVDVSEVTGPSPSKDQTNAKALVNLEPSVFKVGKRSYSTSGLLFARASLYRRSTPRQETGDC
jgi:TonB family protein